MDKFITKRPRVSIGSSSASIGNKTQALDENLVVDSFDLENDIVSDPGLRKPIDSFDVNFQDRIRREYVAKGPCQPKGHAFPQTQFGPQFRSFRDSWFKDFNWLEYSMSKDAVYCFWCFLFKRGHVAPGDEAFTSIF